MSDNKLINKIQQTLDDSVEHLDAATLSRLNQARQKALQTRHRPHSFAGHLPATGLAAITAVVLVAYLWQSQTLQTDQIVAAASHNDLEILSSNTELDLLEEMDFITWLVDEDAS